MKHEEIYHTCDRCGKKIKKQKWFWEKSRLNSPIHITYTTHKTRAYEVSNWIDKFENLFVEEIDLIGYDEEKRKEYDLCGDCRKAFERFMRNENNHD